MPERKDHCEIIGTEGKISFCFFGYQPVFLEKGNTQTKFEFDQLPHVQQPMIQKVVEYFLDQSPNPCSASEGVQVMKMIEEMTTRELVNL